jgi:hypothetical protein
VQELVLSAKALITRIMPDVVEVAWPKQNIISYGVGPKKMSEHFCYIGVFKARINLGFYYGVDLPDPQGLLEGSGKLMRHIKVTSSAQLDDPALQQLVEEASRYLPKLKT